MQKSGDKKAFRRIRRVLLFAGAVPACMLLLLLTTFVVGVESKILGIYRIPGPSMYPTIRIGDRIIVLNTNHTTTRGEVVAYKSPNDPTRLNLHRVVGLAGDEIHLREKELFVNGRKAERQLTKGRCSPAVACTIWIEKLDGKDYSIALSGGPSVEFGPETVPAGHVFLLGDNRDNSLDSRYTGAVPINSVTGVAEIVYWSSDDDGFHWSRIGRLIR